MLGGGKLAWLVDRTSRIQLQWHTSQDMDNRAGVFLADAYGTGSSQIYHVLSNGVKTILHQHRP